MDMHASYFSLDHRVTVLFRPVQIDSVSGIVLTSVVVTCLTILFEGLRCLRVNIQQNVLETNRKVRMLSRVHTVQTLLYMTEFCLAYTIMLCVMTFNLYLFAGVIVGALLGFQLCTFFSRPHIVRRVIGEPGVQREKDLHGVQKEKALHGEQTEQCIDSTAGVNMANAGDGVHEEEENDNIAQVELVSSF